MTDHEWGSAYDKWNVICETHEINLDTYHFDFQGMMQEEYIAFIKHEARSCVFDTSFPYKCTPFSEGLYSLVGKLGLILLYQ